MSSRRGVAATQQRAVQSRIDSASTQQPQPLSRQKCGEADMPVRREHERLQASTRSLWQRENTQLCASGARALRGRVGTSDATLIVRLGVGHVISRTPPG